MAFDLFRAGAKRKRDDNEEADTSSMDVDEDGDSRSNQGVTAVTVPKGKEKEAEFAAPKGGKLADLDEEGIKEKDPNDTSAPVAIEQSHYVIVPSYSAWFDYNKVHSIEKRAVPEFFNGKNKSKTAEVYLAYRNFMVDTYRLNPYEYLSATACRRNLAGDVCSILRVHAFLEQWGLINYQVDAECRPAPIAPPPTSHFMVLADTPMGVQPINPLPSTFQSSKKEGKDGGAEGGEDSKEGVKKEQLGAVGLKTDQYAKQLAAMKSKGAAPGRDWTDQETVLLLEGIEMFRDDWNKVSDHVGTRTQDECIMRFLQLPTMDPYLEEGGSDVLGPLAFQPVPFSQTGNPVMSTVAFLASVVDPRVAAAATKAALEQFAKVKDEVPPLLVEAHAKNVQAHFDRTGVVDGNYGLEKSGIATEADAASKEEKMETDECEKLEEERKKAVEKEKKEKAGGEEKTDEGEGVEKQAKIACSEAVQAAAAAALGAAAVKAKHLATIEERRIKSLVAQLVETQMKKLEMKLKHFDELEQIMDKEKESLEYQRQQLILERQQFHLDQLRYLETRTKQDAHYKMVDAGQLPAALPLGFEISGPPQPTPTIAVAPPAEDKEETSAAAAAAAPPAALPPTAAPAGPPPGAMPAHSAAGGGAPPPGGPPAGYYGAPQQQAPYGGPPPQGYPPQGYGQYPPQQHGGYPGQPGGAPPQGGYYGRPGPYPGAPGQPGAYPQGGAPGARPGAYPGGPPPGGAYPQQRHPGYPPQGYPGGGGQYPPPAGYGYGMPPQQQHPGAGGVPPPSAEGADAATPPMHQGAPGDMKPEGN
ncbi:swsn-1 [Pristionchus pacificus]|uniref:Swsn-1 n=1 Tax=Pristionchus pacificus TaxID=54126 RepID=A0A2A6B875_PRIPA|nr:swsn-1 [Pristionchus pacificus]|eukprot:PDM62082.1 swsn-1 [Pristionchus pacificus]